MWPNLGIGYLPGQMSWDLRSEVKPLLEEGENLNFIGIKWKVFVNLSEEKDPKLYERKN